MKNITAACLTAAMILTASCAPSEKGVGNFNVIPLPKTVEILDAAPFTLDRRTTIEYSEGLQREAEFLKEYIEEATAIRTSQAKTTEGGTIVLALADGLGTEEYRLDAEESTITISGGSAAGVFYGVQTLRKSLPVGRFESVAVPAAHITDYPRFGYRGMMLDVSRHFFDIDFVKEYIDILALHNINIFHWHLTDDQGWRIEIERYPLLTSVSPGRKETVIGRNTDSYDGTPYGHGCFFTKDQIREVVAYAAERHIEVIPEIDMPGHMVAALTAYPELGCTGGPYEVWTRWGVSEDLLCAGNDATIQFAEEVLAEVIELFPSKYIHIGGDECPKQRWEACPKCQQRIVSENLTADRRAKSHEEALQGWFMRTISDFLAEHDRIAIGWDEILENDMIGSNTVVMSWRGTQGGIDAAERGINSIMVPNSTLYFDYYQTKEVDREPLAIGGYNSLDRVYAFEPTAGIPDDRKQCIIGVQANLWTEYILSEKHVEHMVLPRMAALSEIQWCEPRQRNYDDFLDRLQTELKIYNHAGYNYAPYILDVRCSFTAADDGRSIVATLSTLDNAEIRYTLDGTKPTPKSTLYVAPVSIDSSATLSASAIRRSGVSEPMTVKVDFSLSTLRHITLRNNPTAAYTYDGASTLVDGLTGNKNYRTGRWLGFYGDNCDAVIDLGSKRSIGRIDFGVCVNKDDGCFDARGVRVLVSDDGIDFREAASADYRAMTEADDHGVYRHNIEFPQIETRFVEVVILTEQSIPDWHSYAAGQQAFLFVDEISVN